MSALNLLLLIAAVAFAAQVAHPWRRLVFPIVLAGGIALIWSSWQISTSSLELLGVTLSIDPSSRLFVTFGLVLSLALALSTAFQRDRSGLGFLFWSWIPWVIALGVSDFVLAVFAWLLGLIVTALAMKPRKSQRASGAAYFLFVVLAGSACLLLANRFIVIYPLTPERTALVQFAVLFLVWGFGLLLGLFPFHLWIGPMTDDAPLGVSALVLGLGQPIGLWLLTRLLSQYSWLTDRSNFFDLITLGGAATLLIGGVWAPFERRAGRLLGYSAMFALGLTLLSFGRATHDELGYSALGLASRAQSLAVFAAAVIIDRSIRNRRIQQLALVAFLLAGLNLIGLRLGISFSDRLSVLADLASSDQRLFAVALAGHVGMLVGVIRFAKAWHFAGEETASAPEKVQEGILAPEMAIAERVPVLVAGPAVTAPALARVSLEVGPPTRVDGGNGKGPEKFAETTGADGAGDGYSFEEHVRELALAMALRVRPVARRAARSLPQQSRALALLAWRQWTTPASALVLVALGIMLLAFSIAPQFFYDLLLVAIGQPPFVQ